MVEAKLKLQVGLDKEAKIMAKTQDPNEVILEVKQFNVWYGNTQALHDVNIKIRKNAVTALIGPSGCGKSTLLRSLNRMNDIIDGFKTKGEIFYRNEDILGPKIDVIGLRKRIGMIFQKPNPFPMSIYDNIAYGPKLHGITEKAKLDAIVEQCLRQAALWDEVKNRLNESGIGLSGGQQQRLCIARALAIEPEIILMDEPTASLDPIATSHIENLIEDLKRKFTVVIVTHNMQQAMRISDYTAFMYMGKLVEFDTTDKIFDAPNEDLTRNYITGQFG